MYILTRQTGLINIDLEESAGFSELQILNPQGRLFTKKTWVI